MKAKSKNSKVRLLVTRDKSKMLNTLLTGCFLLSCPLAISQISNLSNITAVTAGHNHSLALKNDGSVWAWGSNQMYALGDGTLADRSVPVRVKGPGSVGFLTNIIAIGGGGAHSLALKDDGTVWAWGDNSRGRLGNGTAVNYSSTPVQVVGVDGVGFLNGIVAIAAGAAHNLALKNDGSIYAWGVNFDGRLGNDTSHFDANPTPQQVKGPGGVGILTDIVAIDAGASHSIAVKSNGTVYAWGANTFGALGDGTTDTRRAPVQVQGPDGIDSLSNIVAVAVGGNAFSLALKDDGTVFGWGFNVVGQLGNGTTNPTNTTPSEVVGLSGVVAIAAGRGNFSLALKSDSTLYVWGSNYMGQLGDGTTIDKLTPMAIDSSVIGIGSAGLGHTIILKEDSTVCTVGNNVYGQLGDATTASKYNYVCSDSTPTAGAVSITLTHVSCANGNDGVVSWSDGVNSGTIYNLEAGTYTLEFSDSSGTVTYYDITIEEPPILVTTIEEISSVSCAGGTDGEVETFPSGGTPPYSYIWNTPDAHTTSSASQLATGIYTVTVSDANGCQTMNIVSVTEPAELITSVISLNGTTKDDCNGSASIAGSGGVAPYSYLWNDPQNHTGTTATGLCKDVYSASVIDSNGCIAIVYIVINEVEGTGIYANYGITETTLYPNPNMGQFTIAIQSTTNGYESMDLKIFNVMGVMVHHEVINIELGYIQQNIDLSDNEPGIYLIRLTGNSTVINKQLIIR